MERLEFRAMGCQMLAVVDSDDPAAAAAVRQVSEWFEEWEQALSRFRAESELNRLNRSAGRPFQASEVLWQVVQAALTAAQVSGGIVTPAVLDALETAGYDKSFELIQDPHTAHGAPRPVGDWRAIQMDKTHRRIKLPEGMRIDLGGIAKGWAADQAVKRLSKFGPALVDAGGDVAVSGPMANGEGWPIGVADPANPESNLATLQLQSGAVATSGRDYRRWQANGQAQHHLIDPRTGAPADTDVLTATVIAPSAVEAEMAAKLTLIRGSLPGKRWLDEHPRTAGLLYLDTGETIASNRLSNYLYRDSVFVSLGS
ncbi:MAG: FAD:protein FMN transferase [Anaerolineae bacterium]